MFFAIKHTLTYKEYTLDNFIDIEGSTSSMTIGEVILVITWAYLFEQTDTLDENYLFFQTIKGTENGALCHKAPTINFDTQFHLKTDRSYISTVLTYKYNFILLIWSKFICLISEWRSNQYVSFLVRVRKRETFRVIDDFIHSESLENTQLTLK